LGGGGGGGLLPDIVQVNDDYSNAIKELQTIISEGQDAGKEDEFKIMGQAKLTLGSLKGLPQDLIGSDLEIRVEIEDLSYDATGKEERVFQTAVAHASTETVEWGEEEGRSNNTFTFDIMSAEARALITVNRKSSSGIQTIGDLLLDVRTKAADVSSKFNSKVAPA
jgi:hypothetical protein